MKFLILAALFAGAYCSPEDFKLSRAQWKKKVISYDAQTRVQIDKQLTGNEKKCAGAIADAAALPNMTFTQMIQVQADNCNMTADEFFLLNTKIEKIRAKITGNPAPVHDFMTNAELIEATGLTEEEVVSTLGDDGSISHDDTSADSSSDPSSDPAAPYVGPAISSQTVYPQILPILSDPIPLGDSATQTA